MPGSGDLEYFHSYVAISLGCCGLPMMYRVFLLHSPLFTASLCLSTTLHSTVCYNESLALFNSPCPALSPHPKPIVADGCPPVLSSCFSPDCWVFSVFS